jgi:GDP-L-fucose synthase
MEKTARTYIAGPRGLVGSAIARCLEQRGYRNLIRLTRSELDLLNETAVADFFARERPEYVFLAAARVGGIHANDRYPAQFIHENLVIQTNVIHQAYRHQVRKLLFLGSSCIYPKLCPQPIREEYLLSGYLEPTNEPYAVAKIAGILMCQSYNRQYGTNFIAVMPTNLYGVQDNFHPDESHVIPGLIRRFHETRQQQATTITIWGSGSPRREFLFVDDLADACLFLMQHYDRSEIINVGCGEDISIHELATLIRDIVGHPVALRFDSTMPDGTPRKVLDVSRIKALGWEARTSLREGLKTVYNWYRDHAADST